MNQNTTAASISDDQELAKVLAGINADTNNSTDTSASPQSLSPNDQPAPADTTPPSVPELTLPPLEDTEASLPSQAPVQPSESFGAFQPQQNMPQPTSTGDSSLDGIKQQAISELRPLVDKLNVSPEEKFDTYLLLLRSTDDKELVAPAHEAAVAITDEARRAQALLDIIKEIDFFSQNK